MILFAYESDIDMDTSWDTVLDFIGFNVAGN